MRRSPFAFSVIVHLTLVAVLLLSPMVTQEVVPVPRRAFAFIEAAALPAPAVAPPRAPRPRAAASPVAVPLVTPNAITPETGVVGPGDDVSSFEEVPDDVVGDVAGAFPLGDPLPTPPAPAPPSEPVRVGGSIRQPRKVREVAPVYPAIAQAARVQGVVILEAVIGEDGRVRNLRVLRSIPLLDQAAIDAVRQWQFTPTLLNGVPVPVVMTVTVAFQLRD